MSSPHRVLLLPFAAFLIHGTAAADAQLPMIDRSTVRVFAIGSVGVEDFDVGEHTYKLASPRAGHGTGFIVAPGMVLTAAHVVDDARNIVVRLPESGGFFAARVAYFDKAADISVLAFEPDREAAAAAPLVLAKKGGARVRETVFAIGYPVDATRTTPQSARGIIAGRLEDGTIQLDMTLNGGNSGGPLVNQDDQVIGMVVARGAVERGIQGIGYAVQVERLVKAIAEAQRRIAKGQVPELSKTAKLSAVVVDEMVQHGALREVKEAAAGGLRVAKVERALASLMTRLDDPDLLVFVAASMWNAALAIALRDEQQLAEAGLSESEAEALANRLRASAIGAVRKAVHEDDSVRERSPFVELALESARRETVASAPSHEVEPAPTRSYATTTTMPLGTMPAHRRTDYAVRGGPQARWNPATASFGIGYGFAADIRSPSRPVYVFAGAGYATSNVETEVDSFKHSLFGFDGGLGLGLGSRRQYEIAASVGIAIYSSEVMSTGEATRGYALTGRLGVDYRVSMLRLGTGARAFSGPTLWFEPIYIGFTF